MKRALFEFHWKLSDPERRGPLLAAGRLVLTPPAWLYGAAARLRNALYNAGVKKMYSAPVPVISVGNIVAGGTGKTPVVAWLARFLTAHGFQPAILSRGYGAAPRQGMDDENTLLGRLVPDVPVVINPDRADGAKAAVERAGADVIVLDDGFQHRRIARDFDVVLIDALRPFGGRWMLPRGMLREPLSGLGRADCVILTRTDLVAPERLNRIKASIARYAPGALVCCGVHRPTALRQVGGESAGAETSLSALSEGKWAAFCGIGNPEGFRLTLRKLGVEPALMSVLPDHFAYGAADLRQLARGALQAGCGCLVTTEKDAVKVEAAVSGDLEAPVYALRVEIDFTDGQSDLEQAILTAAGRGSS